LTILTVQEVAKMLRVSEWKVYQLLETGSIKGFKVGRQWRVKTEKVDNYVTTGHKAEAISASSS